MKKNKDREQVLKENESILRQRKEEAQSNLCKVKEFCESELPGVLNEAQTSLCKVKKFCESELPGVLDEAKTNSQRIKEEIIQHAVSNEETKRAWLMLSGLGGVDVDEDGAVALLEERVKDRDSDAMWMLGICYEFGRGIEQDKVQAMKLYQQSMDGGNEIGKNFVSHKHDGRGSGNMRMYCL